MAADHQKCDQFLFPLITECTVLEKAIIVITSRPQGCKNLNVDRQIEVIGFGMNENLLRNHFITMSILFVNFYNNFMDIHI